MDNWFAVTCNTPFSPPRPFISSFDLELLEVSLNGTVRVNNPMTSSSCANRSTGDDVLFLRSPFSFSASKNKFTAVGCDFLAYFTQDGTAIGGCMSICNGNTQERGCYGINCCQTIIPHSLQFFGASITAVHSSNIGRGCKNVFMVDQEWFTADRTNISAVQNMDYVPVVLDWGISNGMCELAATNGSTANTSITFCGTNTYCSSNQSSIRDL
ncbi:hypothetical protein L1049_023562 [Liquidambar formosana]|uniref:Wall-associated receptor kinase domain-containing protein n=1 Tax=Liquidambar formosana TaxID=63359 RepID=A0AAP0RTK0_LIQFO